MADSFIDGCYDPKKISPDQLYPLLYKTSAAAEITLCQLHFHGTKKEQEISAIKRKAKKVIVNGQEGLEKYKSNQSIVGTVATDIYYDLENLGASINDLSLVELRVLCDECISHIAERKTSDNVNRASRKLENSELTIIYDKAAETYAEFMDIVCNLDEYQLRCNSCKYYHHSTCMRAHGPQSGQRVLPTDGCNRHEVDTER